MPSRPRILATAQAQFPKSANKTVIVANAWRPFGEKTQPEPNGWDEGWKHVGKPATYEVVDQLKVDGYTHINLEAGGTSWPFKDVHISALI